MVTTVKLREGSLTALVRGGSGGVTEWVHQTPDLQSDDTTPYKHCYLFAGVVSWPSLGSGHCRAAQVLDSSKMSVLSLL